jgi:hypothetical protein
MALKCFELEGDGKVAELREKNLKATTTAPACVSKAVPAAEHVERSRE